MSWTATVAFACWPLIALMLYRALPVNRATLWTILGGYLLLPSNVAVKFGMVPPLDKVSIPSFAAFACCMLFARRSPAFRTGFGLIEVVSLVFIASPFVTSELNGDPIVFGYRTLPGLDAHEGLSASFAQLVLLIPFFLGRRLLRSSEDTAEILRVLVIAGLFFSLLVLFEIRMSPQLNRLVYGFTNSWISEKRDGGFRAVVFMQNGLLVSFFMMTAVAAATALWRTASRESGVLSAGITAYLSVVLALTKSWGALLYGCALVPLVYFGKPRLQIYIAIGFATIAIAYPILRATDLVPTNGLVEVAQSFSADRAQSLDTRFQQEKHLLDRALQRPYFGWGRFGRNRVYSGQDGRDLTLSDGRWIITIGQFGFVGFLAEFGLLALAIFRAASVLRFTESISARVNLAALALMLAINMLDLLPNDSFTPWTWLLAGTLMGRAEALRAAERVRLRATYVRNTAALESQGQIWR